MPTQVLTTEFLATLPDLKPPSGSVSYFDTEVKGFMLECRSSGGATFYFRYRDASGTVRMKRIGRSDEISLTEARCKAHAMKQLVKEGGDPKVEGYRFKDIPTFSAFVQERYLPFAKSRKRSWQNDVTILDNHLLPYFGKFRINRITRANVIAMQQATRDKGYASSSCNRMLVLLKFIFNCAVRWDVLPNNGNPCVGVQPFKNNGGKERYLSKAEADRLFDELDRNRNVQVAQIIRLLLYTGARKQEILSARWEFVDFDRRILTVPLSKSGKPRHIPLSDAAIELLQSLPRDPKIPWVFFNTMTNKPIVSITVAWESIRKKVGLGDVRLHDLRHSFASFLVNSGRSLYEVQKILGHHDPKMTMRYAHLAPGTLIEAANIVGDLMGRRSPSSVATSPV